MGVPHVPNRRIRSPRVWLGLAFLGLWLYMLSQLFRIYPAPVTDAFALTTAEAQEALAITSGLGQIILFSGLVAALWRANRAAGLSGSGVRGLFFGAAGVGVLLSFEIALLADWVRIVVDPVNLMARAPALDIGVLLGSALVFAGLASLGVGLAQATGLFAPKAPAQSRIPSIPEETG